MSEPRARPALPFVLFIAGLALSCSTACMTAMAVSEINQGMRNRAMTADQHRLLKQNIQAHLAGRPRPQPVNTVDSIREALLLAMPFPEDTAGNTTPGTVEVTASTHSDGRQLYVITATGDFNGPYNQTFLAYAGELRWSLVPTPVFRVTLVHQTNGFRHVYPAVLLQ